VAEEVKALVDVDHPGFLRCQPQPQRCEHGCHLLAQFLGVAPVARHHQDQVIRIADELPVALAVSFALLPLPACAHFLTPLPVEMVVQR
jgi:hypothetical protein